MSTLKSLKESFESLNKTPQDKEPHNIFNKVTKKVISSHPDKASAYKELIDTHKYHPDMTVLHHTSKQYGQ